MALKQLSSIHGVSSHEQEEEDDDLVILPNVDNSELILQFKHSLVGRIFNTERRSVETLISLLPRPSIWDVEGRVRGMDLGNHRFQFDFDSEADLVKVLSKRPCHFNKWAISLECWIPHVGDTFPNTMTFWISVIGIPTHFWMDPIFDSLGGRLGTVGLIEARSAKVEVEINMDRPLKFALRAKLPSGEIVPVKLVYSNLHRYCRHCRLVSHELDSCPKLTEAERVEKLASLEEDRDLANSHRFDAHKQGENLKRPLPQPIKDRRSGEGTQRDTRDSVWKRIDSRYDPRGDPRPSLRYDHRQVKKPTDRDRSSPSRDSYNKRRYDESFVSSKQREASRREKDKGKGREKSPTRKVSQDLNLDAASKPIPDATDFSQKTVLNPSVAPARQVAVSPELNRERPFKLNLQKRASTDLKLKGKISEINEVEDEESSARKSLSFEAPSDPPSVTLPAIPFQGPPTKDNTKSWYEMTLEEEGTMVEEDMIPQEQQQISDVLKKNGLPLTERILEEDDWLDDGNDFGDADGNDFGEENTDFMEEDDLLGEELQAEEDKLFTIEKSGMEKHITEAVATIEDGSSLGGMASVAVVTKSRSPKRVNSSPEIRSSVPSAMKKKGMRSPTTIGVSLRQRNLLAGIGSPKAFGAGHGLSGSKSVPSGPSLSLDQKKAQGAVTHKTNNSKVASGRPPKAP